MTEIATRAFRTIFHDSKVCSLQPFVQDPAAESTSLRINVLFTEMRETLAALSSAATLSTNLSARIVLLVPLTVPHPLPLDRPPVSLDFVCRRIRELAAAVATEIEAFVYLSRDPQQAIMDALTPASLIVLGSRNRWLFEKSKRIARKLRRRGHRVVLAETR
jgi:hypothetical protein